MPFNKQRRVVLKSLGVFSTLSSVLLIAPNTLALGEIYPGGFPPSVTANIIWTHDPATVTTEYLNTYILPGARQWNGITLKASVYYSANGAYRIKAVIGNSLDSSAVGEMVPYCPSGPNFVDCYSDKNWSVARVYGYENAMVRAGFMTTNRVKVFAHEFGHSLSMDHVKVSGVNAVMRQGPSTLGVQQYDKDNLKFKWGN